MKSSIVAIVEITMMSNFSIGPNVFKSFLLKVGKRKQNRAENIAAKRWKLLIIGNFFFL